MSERETSLGPRRGTPGEPFGIADPSLTRLLGAIGRPSFYDEMLGCLGQICGAEHVHVFLFDGDKPRVVSELSRDGSAIAVRQTQDYLRSRLWLVDRDMEQGSRVDAGEPRLFQLDSGGGAVSELRDFYTRQRLRERLMLFNRESFGVLGLSMLRPSDSGILGADDARRLDAATGMVFPMVVKHVEAVTQSQRMIQALTSLSMIENTMALAPQTPSPRELQVAARLLYGLSASSIAVDLGIGQETVLTHRKRLYERLGIGCHRELLLWYLELYAHVGRTVIEPLRFPD
ncbi:helix-turn-helix transcriptional regulator [Sphingopyxis sp. 550A]